MGATEALPAVSNVVRWPLNPDGGLCGRPAPGCWQRPTHETSAGRSRRLRAKIAAFLVLMKLHPVQTTAVLAAQRRQISRPAGETPEACACEEIADMIYRAACRTRARCLRCGVWISASFPVRVEIRLAQMPKGQRLTWMIPRDAVSRTSGHAELRLVQLAADEGRPASRAAA